MPHAGCILDAGTAIASVSVINWRSHILFLFLQAVTYV
jgi:hypothetical protein